MAVGSQKQYLSRLLDTQRLRGVTAGEVFSSYLQSTSTQSSTTTEEAMETEPSGTRHVRRKQPANRTLSTLESRVRESMGEDTDGFIKNVSNSDKLM